ncbi:phospholipid-transporting ATPase ABCA1-like [Argiope bruennichi]|uniref:phospholipid-transporting ATPase ABCA1-like n=1 Tax=Argiope bruennichi TaxID=94029 RepID=UPI0024940A5C|nr:phospholipid-transporting ATPase ABCA1-like [Argiope bruennichi]
MEEFVTTTHLYVRQPPHTPRVFGRQGSNSQPKDSESTALPTKLSQPLSSPFQPSYPSLSVVGTIYICQRCKMVETNRWRQFLVLLYKGLLLRKRHFIVTFFETIFPILIASIPCMIKSEKSISYMEKDSNESHWINQTTYPAFDPYTIAERTHNLTTPKGFDTEEEMVNYYVHQKGDNVDYLTIGTVLRNFQNVFPTSLTYKIRYGGGYSGPKFSTNMKYRVKGPHDKNDYLTTYFLAWQSAIEETFIQRKATEHGKVTELKNFKIWMRKFPYPQRKDTQIIVTLTVITPWVLSFGYLIFVMNMVRRIIEEKTTRSKELLKMMGMTDFTYWASTFANYFLCGFITIFIIAILFKIPFKNATAFVENTDFLLLLIILVMFMVSLTLSCMALSVLFNRAYFGVTALLLIYVPACSLLTTKFFLSDASQTNYFLLPTAYKVAICLLPQGGLITAFNIISAYEAGGEGVHWNNLTEFLIAPNINMQRIILIMLLSCIIYIIIIWYVGAVWPWQPGVPKPFYFFLLGCWRRKRGKEGVEESDFIEKKHSSEFFEEEPTDLPKGIVIKNLSKKFHTGLTSKLAVNNVSLNVYEGQITVLLGHNGAGKTTTINMLTGIHAPTSGSALVNNLDILKEKSKIRRSLGVCPQHNVLFDTITVEEHLRIYAAMKGTPWKNIQSEVNPVLDILKLTHKRKVLAKNLSIGMKKKLNLGMALVGGSKILLLDEPTVFMDVEVKRSVWNALMELKQERTIILTTNQMEEADAVADRIAIIAGGELQCYGSPMFLKSKFGIGYQLHIVKDESLKNISSLVTKNIPEAIVTNETAEEVSFHLTETTESEFANLFEKLEEKKVKFGVTVTTMEDVFLKIAEISGKKYGHVDEEVENVETEDVYGDSSTVKLNEHPLRPYLLSFSALLLKRFQYFKRHWSVLVAQLALPFILMCFCLSMIRSNISKFATDYDPLKLDISSVYGDTDGFYYGEKPGTAALTKAYKNVFISNNIRLENVSDPVKYVLDYGKGDIAKYLKRLMVGGTIDEDSNRNLNLTAWFNGEPYHAAPLSLILMHTALLLKVTNSGVIDLTNAPLPERNWVTFEAPAAPRVVAAVFVPLTFAFLTASFALLPIHERATKAKLLQLMCGVPSALYWSAMFFWDFMIHCVVCLLLIIPYAIFVHYAFFGIHSNAIGTAFLLMLLYGVSAIPFSYLCSLLFRKGNSGFFAVIGICIIIGSISIVMITLLVSENPTQDNIKVDKTNWAFRVFPMFSLTIGMSNLHGLAFDNALCESLSPEVLAMSCNQSTIDSRNPVFGCCEDICKNKCKKFKPLITWDRNACGRDVFALAIAGLAYLAILFLVEYFVNSYIFRAIRYKVSELYVDKYLPRDIVEDSDVLQEEERVHNLIVEKSGSGEEALSVRVLTKVFKPCCAVNQLSFSIRKQECFGLLGVNGAGKTTSFRMLTGDIQPSKGNAYIEEVSLRKNLKEFQSRLGYCPQTDALIDRLTGREMLSLFGRLRGLSESDVETKVNKLIQTIDLVDDADKETQFYSGGNKRKLSFAIALIGSPPVILLDEPTAGVDPISRRKMWNIVSLIRSKPDAAILLTTQSIKECEELCGRLGIMVNGRLRCLGSTRRLKSKFGQGYTLIIKVKSKNQKDVEFIKEIKTYIDSNLNGAKLKDEYQGILQYHVINPSITLSHLFKFMSGMKEEYDLEEYLISDTSLEQVFLALARIQRDRYEKH